MNNDGPMHCAIVFADVVGSTRLYESVGDLAAKRMILDLEQEIAKVIEQAGGEVVEIVGDEVMSRFDDANAAVTGACQIQEHVDAYTAADGRSMAVRIGMHFGPVLREDERLFGDTVNTAARMAAIAQARQIIVTDGVVDALDPSVRALARRFDRVKVKGKQEQIVIYDVLWRRDNVTRIQPAALPQSERTPSLHLHLHYREVTHVLNAGTVPFPVGRDLANALVVSAQAASRNHATVEFNRGKFVLTDASTNGTYVLTADGQSLYLRRESVPLVGRGRIGLGEPVSPQNEHVIAYDVR